MNLAFARNGYNLTRVNKGSNKYDGYEAVKMALSQVIENMESLQSDISVEEKEYHFERALLSIYFLQKCLDFEKGGELARNLFRVYEHCRQAVINYSLKKTVQNLEAPIQYTKAILEGWEGIYLKI